MGGKTLGDFLVALATGFLSWWMARSDLKRAERQEMVIEGLHLDQEGLAILANLLGHPDVATRVRLRDGAPNIIGLSNDPGASDHPQAR